jgi:hypothetical protein
MFVGFDLHGNRQMERHLMWVFVLCFLLLICCFVLCNGSDRISVGHMVFLGVGLLEGEGACRSVD